MAEGKRLTAFSTPFLSQARLSRARLTRKGNSHPCSNGDIVQLQSLAGRAARYALAPVPVIITSLNGIIRLFPM